MKMENVKFVNGEEYEKWCKENGRDKEHKLSCLEFLAKVKKDKKAKEVFDKLEKGEITLDNVSVKTIEHEEEIKVSDLQLEGLKGMLIGLSKFGCDDTEEDMKASNEKEDEIEEMFDKFIKTGNRIGLEVLFKGVIENYGDEFLCFAKATLSFLETGVEFCDLVKNFKSSLDKAIKEGE